MIRQLASFPNLLTLMRLIFIPFIVIALLDSSYDWALGLFVLAGLSDGLDGLVARKFGLKTELGQYLDPIADKLLLSTMFLTLSFMHEIRWKVTILVFSRDVLLLIVAAVLYITQTMRDFRVSIFGKANTMAQIIAVFLVLVDELMDAHWLTLARQYALWTVMVLTIASGVHYIIIVALRLRAENAPTLKNLSQQVNRSVHPS